MAASDKLKQLRNKIIKTQAKRITEITKKSAAFTMEMVIERTKSGMGTNGKLKALSGNYIGFRRRWESFLAEDTSPAKSNLTATGQLLDALYFRAVKDKFIIKINTKNRYEGLGGEATIDVNVTKKKKEARSKLTNEEVRKFVEDAGREFLSLNDQEKEKLIKYTKNLLRELALEISQEF